MSNSNDTKTEKKRMSGVMKAMMAVSICLALILGIVLGLFSQGLKTKFWILSGTTIEKADIPGSRFENCNMSRTTFDNIDLSKMVVPSLTTINQPKKQLGHQACEMLINLIENPSTPTQHILLDTELSVRSST